MRRNKEGKRLKTELTSLQIKVTEKARKEQGFPAMQSTENRRILLIEPIIDTHDLLRRRGNACVPLVRYQV